MKTTSTETEKQKRLSLWKVWRHLSTLQWQKLNKSKSIKKHKCYQNSKSSKKVWKNPACDTNWSLEEIPVCLQTLFYHWNDVMMFIQPLHALWGRMQSNKSCQLPAQRGFVSYRTAAVQENASKKLLSSQRLKGSPWGKHRWGAAMKGLPPSECLCSSTRSMFIPRGAVRDFLFFLFPPTSEFHHVNNVERKCCS